MVSSGKYHMGLLWLNIQPQPFNLKLDQLNIWTADPLEDVAVF